MANDKTNAMRLLDAAGADYRCITWQTDCAESAEAVAARLGEEPERVFKTLVTVGKSGAHYVFVVPAGCELDLKKAARASGEKNIVMIKQKELLPLTGYIHGGCSPVGMKKVFPTFIDETAALWDSVFVSGGRLGCQINASVSELGKAVPVTLADITE